jgi:hypothetical protein
LNAEHNKEARHCFKLVILLFSDSGFKLFFDFSGRCLPLLPLHEGSSPREVEEGRDDVAHALRQRVAAVQKVRIERDDVPHLRADRAAEVRHEGAAPGVLAARVVRDRDRKLRLVRVQRQLLS